MRLGCGTNEVEKYAQIVCKQSVRKGGNRKLIKDAMKHKADDAKFAENRARSEFVKCKNEYNKVIKNGSMIDVIFNRMMKDEVEHIWNEGKIKNKKKVETLVLRWLPKENVGSIRNVMYADIHLEEKVASRNTDLEPIVYDNLVVSDNVKAALKLHPKFRAYGKIDTTRIEIEIEKGISKARYALMNSEKNDENEDVENNDVIETNVYHHVKKVADYSNLRVTDLPTCQRLYPPQPATVNKELHMQNLREKLLMKVEEYKAKRCNKNGFVKKGNITNTEFEGLKELRENENIAVFSTDKYAKLTADTKDNYERALNEHI